MVPTALKKVGEEGADIGADVRYQYINGVKTNEPLWPWPMEDRIFAETGFSVTWEANGGLWKNGVDFEEVYNPTAPSTNNEYFIATTNGGGSDFNDCSEQFPCATIVYASTKLTPGDILYIRGGTYDEGSNSMWTSIYQGPAGTAENPITIKAYLNEKPVFDGSSHGTAGDGNGWYFLNFAAATHKYLIIDGLITQYYKGTSITIADYSDNITIQNCIFKNNRYTTRGAYGIYIEGYDSWPKDIIIKNNIFQDMPDVDCANCNGAGIHFWHAQSGRSGERIYIYNNIFNNVESGVLIADSPKDVYIINNTFYNNEDYSLNLYNYGADVPDNAENIDIKNNIIYNTNGLGTYVSSYYNDVTEWDYNFWYRGNGGNIIEWWTPALEHKTWTLAQFVANTIHGNNSSESNPLFNSTNPLDTDFLKPTSVEACTGGIGGGHIGAVPCDSSCSHEADNNPCDGCVDGQELPAFISKWKEKGTSITMPQLMLAIKNWKECSA